MIEHRPFTNEDGDRFFNEWRKGEFNALGTTIAVALNAAFSEGLAVPQPAMRTTPVTGEECKAVNGTLVNIFATLFPHASAAQALQLLHVYDEKFGESKYSYARVAEAINTVLGLREPEPPLVTLDEAKQMFTNLSGGSSFEYERKRLEDFVRSKMPKPEAGE